MASTSPSPNSSPPAVPPASTTPPPLPSSPSSPPPPEPSTTSPTPDSSTTSSTSPSSQQNADPPAPATPATPSPPPQSPPPAVVAAPPPTTLSTPPPQPSVSSPPPSPGILPSAKAPTASLPTPPRSVSSSPPPPPPSAIPAPSISNSPPPPSSKPLEKSPPPPSDPPARSSPPPSDPPARSSPPPSDTRVSSPPPPPPSSKPQSPPPASSSSPPPPPLRPPENSPPPVPSKPPENSPPSPPPPPSSQPPENSPPPPPSKPPENSPPPPSSKPPKNSPPPPATEPSRSSPPQPPLSPPDNSPPPPVSMPPGDSALPPMLTPQTPSATQRAPPPPSISAPTASPPPSILRKAPPPASVVSPPSNSSSPPRIPAPPAENPTANNYSSDVPENSNSTGKGGGHTGLVAVIGVGVGLVVLSLIVIICWLQRKQKKKVSGLNGGYVMPSPLCSSPKSGSSLTKTHSSAPLLESGSGKDFVYVPPEPGGLGNSRSWFTYEELLKATNGFSAQNLLGEGGFGSVYKGYLPDGREVAVKQLKVGGEQGEREFKAEVEIISRIHHRHLVLLVGYCISENRRLLVYEYVPNNTLYFHLHEEGRPVMDWATRVKVAAGAARGIAYLHEDCHPRIIHRDIKSSNILLDNNFEARVSDFGLAKLALDANTHVSTRVMGTFGYMAPEYASSGKLTEKSDVYSFGVVLLELITGRKPVDTSQPLGDESLVEWARPLLNHALDSEEFEDLADPRLEKNYVESEMFRMIEAAAACVRHSAARRPRMGQVVRAFDSIATSDLTNGMRLGESEVYNSTLQSAEIRLFQRMAFGSQEYSTDFFSQSSWN